MSNNIYSPEAIQWITDNQGKYKNVRIMYENFIKYFDYVSYYSFLYIRKKLNVQSKERFYSEEEKNFITECIVDREIGYAQIAPLFNKKFNRNKTAHQLKLAGEHWGLKVIHFNHKWKENYKKKINCIDYCFKNQAPIGTIIRIRRGGKYRLRIKIKLIPKELICSKKDFRDNNEYWYSYPRYIYEQHYNIKLKSNEYIFHLDGNIYNNNIENLICGTYGTLGFAAAKGYLASEPEIRSIGLKLGKLNSIIKNEV